MNSFVLGFADNPTFFSVFRKVVLGHLSDLSSPSFHFLINVVYLSVCERGLIHKNSLRTTFLVIDLLFIKPCVAVRPI